MQFFCTPFTLLRAFRNYLIIHDVVIDFLRSNHDKLSAWEILVYLLQHKISFVPIISGNFLCLKFDYFGNIFK